MSTAIEQLKSQADELTSAERADLASYLLGTLKSVDEDADEWRIEIARRVANFRAGKAVGRPLDAVLAELREQYP